MTRPRPSWRSTPVAASLALALLAAACSDGVVTGEGLGETPTARVTTATPTPSPVRTSPTASESPSPTHGTLRIVVQDHDDLEARSGVPVRYTGRRSGTLVSGRGGTASMRLPGGDYRVEVVAGCHPRLEVFRGSGGTAGVAPGEDPAVARLTVDARRRFWGGTPLQYDVEPPWPAGRTVTLRYRLFDRCKDVEAPRTAISDVRYRLGNLEMVGTPARVSDANADVRLQIRCKAAGDASLTMFDPENPDDATDLLSLRPPTIEPSDTWCGS